MPNISSGGRTKCREQDLKDMTRLVRRCPAIKFRTLDSGNAPERYEVSYYLRTIIGEDNGVPMYREADLPSVFIFDLTGYPFGKVRTTSVTKPVSFHPAFNECGQFDFPYPIYRCFGGEPLVELVILVAKAIQYEYIYSYSFNSNSRATAWIEKYKHDKIFPCDKTIIPEYINIVNIIDNYYYRRERGY